MKQIELAETTVEQMVALFREIAIAQDHARLMSDYDTFNRLFEQMEDVKKALKARNGDQRRALMSLYRYGNTQVRYTAAVATVGIAPEAARQVLQTISDRDEYPQAADARAILRSLDKGKLPLGA
jgi:hypothetical protein